MAWCPVCKCEYKEGVEKCADCGTALVESLGKKSDSVEEVISVLTETDLLELAEAEEDMTDKTEEVPKIKKAKVYQNSAELSNENKSSAYILLSVGIIGSIILVLICLDVIPIYYSVTSKVITSIVMGTLFLVFIVMGIVSLKNAKKLDEKASAEGDLTKEIMSYCMDHMTTENIDSCLSTDEDWADTPEELKYFKRTEHIKALITKQFMNLEEEYVEFICDEVYTNLYE